MWLQIFFPSNGGSTPTATNAKEKVSLLLRMRILNKFAFPVCVCYLSQRFPVMEKILSPPPPPPCLTANQNRKIVVFGHWIRSPLKVLLSVLRTSDQNVSFPRSLAVTATETSNKILLYFVAVGEYKILFMFSFFPFKLTVRKIY